MAAQGEEDLYATLLLTDTYLPGALVLAHSLRDAGTTKKLAVLVTLDTVSADVVTQLKGVYDYVIPTSRIQNEHPANLDLMNRRDLHSAFTKINLWRQTQFRKIVYVDADIVAYRAPDELFSIEHAFSAAPDIGWPDLFNSGLMVLTPNMGDYYAMMAMAQRGISFDGADQGLLNMYFKNNYNRLSFTYNVTPSAHYQYMPAYKHFQSSISMVHFIGSEKPWIQGRDRSTGNSPYDQMVGRWWAVYDRHYRKESSGTTESQPETRPPELVQYFVAGEYQPTISYVVPVGEPASDETSTFYGQQYRAPLPPSSSDAQHTQHQHHQSQQWFPPAEQHSHAHDHHHQEHQHYPQDHPPQEHQHHQDPQHQHHEHQHHEHHHAPPHSHPPPHSTEPPRAEQGTHTEARKDQAHDQPQPPPRSEHQPEPQPQPDLAPSWDAQRHPPPADSKPEAINFPQTHYAMSSDTAPFVPPERYPTPPKNMWYEVPKEPPANPKEKPKPVFPWETHQPRPTRVFAHHEPEPAPSEPTHTHTGGPWEHPSHTPPGSQTQAETATSGSPWTSVEAPSGGEAHTHTPTNSSPRTVLSAPSDIWSSFPRTNAWDTVPEINRYVDALAQKHRRTRSRGGKGLPPGEGGGGPGSDFGWSRRGSRVTDFPSEDDRPSLPVTPAPIRRPRRQWGVEGGHGHGAHAGGGEGEEQLLLAAEGVPAQAEWDPAARLAKLARQQSELLFQRLGGWEDEDVEGGQEEEEAGLGKRREIPARALPFGSEGVRSPTYVAPAVVSPKPVKPVTGTSPVTRILAAAPELIVSQEVVTPVTVPVLPSKTALAPELIASQEVVTPVTVPVLPSKTAPAPVAATTAMTGLHAHGILAPSYQGPGAAFEKGEDIPTFETPALPTEEDLDVLDT